jgi:uncharacterized protein YcsI (UPF0317 family)
VNSQATASESQLYQQLLTLPVSEARQLIRSGAYAGHTAGIGIGKQQGNLVILPAASALDFFRFCQRNPKPCPLVAVSDTGNPMLPTLGPDIDVRTDIPQYNIYRHGKLDEQLSDITELWREDLVAFIIGCSFTFEEALMAEGIRIPHIEANSTVPMYRTSFTTEAAGPFSGPLVVSMRPMSKSDAIRACTITARFPHAHGAPVHIGDAREIGIQDLSSPDYGDPPIIDEQQVSVFWACGVTPQAALQSAQLPLCITHAPGRMLISDIASCG